MQKIESLIKRFREPKVITDKEWDLKRGLQNRTELSNLAEKFARIAKNKTEQKVFTIHLKGIDQTVVPAFLRLTLPAAEPSILNQISFNSMGQAFDLEYGQGSSVLLAHFAPMDQADTITLGTPYDEVGEFFQNQAKLPLYSGKTGVLIPWKHHFLISPAQALEFTDFLRKLLRSKQLVVTLS